VSLELAKGHHTFDNAESFLTFVENKSQEETLLKRSLRKDTVETKEKGRESYFC